MSIDFEGRVAIVTGAGGGLGRDYALLLASRGAKVVVNDLGVGTQDSAASTAPAARVVEEIEAAGGQAIASYDSVADRDGAKRIVDAAIAVFGRVDILINNAGILRDRSFIKTDLDEFELVLKVHLAGSVYMTHAAWPHMIEQGYGRIVLTTSIAGLCGNFGQTSYGTAKMGLIGLMNSLVIEGARKGVRINAISPGAATRMTGGGDHPLAAYMTGDMVAPVVAYLVSERNEGSGQIIEAMAGGVSRIAITQSEGHVFDPRQPLDIDQVAAAWSAIADMTGSTLVTHGIGGRVRDNLVALGILNGAEVAT